MWRYVLCGVGPDDDERYGMVDLVFDFYATYPLPKFAAQEVNATEEAADPLNQVMEGTMDRIFQAYGLEETSTACQEVDTEARFRAMVKAEYIDNYSFALEALMEGLVPLGTFWGMICCCREMSDICMMMIMIDYLQEPDLDETILLSSSQCKR